MAVHAIITVQVLILRPQTSTSQQPAQQTKGNNLLMLHKKVWKINLNIFKTVLHIVSLRIKYNLSTCI